MQKKFGKILNLKKIRNYCDLYVGRYKLLIPDIFEKFKNVLKHMKHMKQLILLTFYYLQD